MCVEYKETAWEMFPGPYVVEVESISHTPTSWSRTLFLSEGVNPVKYMQQQTQIICPSNFYLELWQFTEDTEMSKHRWKYGRVGTFGGCFQLCVHSLTWAVRLTEFARFKTPELTKDFVIFNKNGIYKCGLLYNAFLIISENLTIYFLFLPFRNMINIQQKKCQILAEDRP
jgi:hypothetical protein